MACGCADRRAALRRAAIAIAEGRRGDAAAEMSKVKASAAADVEMLRAAARAAVVRATNRLVRR